MLSNVCAGKMFSRRRAEDKAAELKKALASIQASGSSECERLRAQLAQQSMQLNALNEQVCG